MLIADKITYAVGEKQILFPTSATFEPGQLYGIIGHNGSGKSTFVKLLARQQPCSTGSVFVDSKLINHYKTKQLARKISYLPQYLPADIHLTVAELVKLGRYPWKGSLKRFDEDDDKIIQNALTQTHTLSYQKQFLQFLSGGERQRVWLAMCLAQQSHYLILDEPLSALDIHHQIEVMTLLQTLAHQQNITIIVVMHDINLASEFCDAILAFKQGHLIYNQPAPAFIKQSTLHDIYDVNFTIIDHPIRHHPVALP
ncbi:ABC transporter ATP-binding protein [Orbus sturtevantii]|uniref:ABC transporter ATP-binding protein n=1 Tax=Orbus sturtevantii TaxID=3074109 RepID=UPI00370D7E01